MALFHHRLTLSLLALSIVNFLPAGDNLHFYRAPRFNQEPRLEKPWLATWQLNIGGGSTSTGYNQHGNKVALFDIYGSHNMQYLGAGIAKDFGNPYDILLDQLTLLPSNDQFGHLSIDGKFRIAEIHFDFFQNLSHGFFIHEHLPLRTLETSNIRFCDLSPATGYPNTNTLEWQLFLAEFDAILARYGLCPRPICNSGIGDFSFLLGWTINYEQTETIDFIDATFQTGILLPTGNKKNEHELFEFPLGYNGHYGLPVYADIACGLYDWLTFGAHLEALIFAHKSRIIRIKTDPKQSGIIKLKTTCAQIKAGTQCAIGGYIKADHIARGLSLIFGYSFAYKGADSIKPLSPYSFETIIAHNDETFSYFKMHTIHFQAEYDFTKENHTFGPRIAFFYDLEIAGKRTFKTNMAGGYFGVDVIIEA